MKKKIGYAMLAGMVLLLGSALPGYAMGHGGGFHGGGHGGFHHGSRVFIGTGLFLGGPLWWDPWPYYAPPPVVVQSPPTYIQTEPQGPQTAYWYYCQSPQGYYPYVQQCPGGWMTVVPPGR
jgi:hypothetical protein